MDVVVASELLSCAGRPLSSAAGVTAEAHPQVTDEEAVTDAFIPADAVSAVLISARRVLVTGGVLSDERVLPLTVVRFLDLDASARAAHAWTKPLQLRPASRRAKRKRADSAFPVCRMEQTLTLVPDSAALFLIGGLKVGGKDEGRACKSMFAFDVNAKVWESVELAQNTKTEKEQALGPRFAHTAVYVAHLGGDTRSSKARKSSGYLLVYGGYVSTEDTMPCDTVHVFDVRTSRWSLLPAETAAAPDEDEPPQPPPRRAYHAGVVSPSSRYFLAHGGQCSKFDASDFLSSDLVAFDMLRSKWVRPTIKESSCSPPTARKRHCMVSGIGKHEGTIVLFGGELCSGQFSNELFILHMIEPSTPAQNLYAVWEKVDVRSPEPLIPIPPDNLSPQEVPSQENATKKHTGTAGGCLIAVPELNKYLVVGGRGAYGIRNSPLVLDASDAEKLDRFEAIIPRQNQQAKRLPVPVRQFKQPPKTLARGRAPVKGNTNKGRKIPISPAEEGRGAPPKQTTDKGRKIPINAPEESLLRQISDEDNLPILPKLKTVAGEQMQDDFFASDQRPLSEQRVSSLQPTRSNESPSLSASRATVAAEKKNQKNDERPHDVRPATSVRPTSAVEVGRRKSTAESDDYVLDLVDDDDDFDVQRVRDVQGTGDSMDLETPPTKRRRFINGSRQGGTSSPANDDNALSIENGDVPGSGGSDFVAASDLAKKGKSRVGRTGRGRGRPRGGLRRKRAATVAEEREALGEREAQEALVRENARLVKLLQSENVELKRQRDACKKDLLDLNEQMKSLLSEVQGLRAFRREQISLNKASSSKRNRTPLSGHRDVSQDSKEVEATGPVRSNRGSFGGSDSEELKILQSKTADLMEEYQELIAERDELNKALRDAEEGKRALETELHFAKNKFEQLETERDQLCKQTNELRALARHEASARENAATQLRKAEDGKSSLKRELERLQEQLRDADSRRVEEKLQLSNAERLVSTVQCQLSEAQKKYDQFDSKERRLKGELGSQQGKLLELQQLVNQANVEKQRLEEQNIQLVTDNESLKTDYEKKLRECQTALKDVEKSRQALDHERKQVLNLDMEATKLRRDVLLMERECSSLTSVIKRREAALQALRPALLHITSEIEVLTRSAEEDDLGRSFSRIKRYPPNDNARKRIERNGENADGENERAIEGQTVVQRDRNNVKGTETSNPKVSHEDPIPGNEDLRSPVPPSEEEEEP